MSLPSGFKQMAEKLPGLDAPSFLAAMEEEPSVGVRINPSKLRSPAEAGYPVAARVEWNTDGFYLDERPVFTLNPLLHAGAIYVQDPSSMVYGNLMELALTLLPEERRETPRVLDMCASPGGKTTAMASRLPAEGVIVANEYVGQRTGALRENMAKWGYPAYAVCSSDSADVAKTGEIFDIVAVDAPCSGEGMMRKEAMAREQWSERLVEECSALQREILSNACKTLRPGGIMIYSTCTFNLREDEENLKFLVEDMGLQPVDTGLVGMGGIMPALVGEYPALRFMPHATRGEGLFVGMLRKPEDTGEGEVPSYGSRLKPGRNKKKGKEEHKIDFSPLKDWLDKDVNWNFFTDGTRAEAMTPAVAEICSALEPHVKILDRGVTVAELRGRDWCPAVPLVLSKAYRRGSLQEVEVEQPAALSYLRGEPLQLPAAAKGMTVVTYQGLPLGLVKNLGNRANNLHPKQWKIKHL